MSARTGVAKWTLALLVAALCAGRPVAAQVILEGRVLDDVSSQPIAGARVVLRNQYVRFVASTVTDQAGRFRFERKGYGMYRVEVSAIGRKSAMSPPLWMTLESDSTVVEVRLTGHAVLLAPLEVVAVRMPRASPALEAMELRRARGVAIHISRDDIAKRQPTRLSDVLLEIPGIYANRLGNAGTSGLRLYMARALPGPAGGDCPMQVFLDGMRATRDEDVLIDDLANPLDVEAIEIFRGLSSIPPEFLTPDARCGVVAIWTRRALPAPRP